MKQRTPDSADSPFNFRPRASVAERLLKLCKQLGYERPQALNYCAEAVLDMIEAQILEVPQIVALARNARATNSTLTDERKPFPGQEPRDKREISLGYPAHPATPFYSEILAGKPSAIAADTRLEPIYIPAGVARAADFAVRVFGNSMEPLIFEGEVAVFHRAEVAGNGQIVAAIVDGQMILKKFMQQNGGPARLESLNKKYKAIPINEDARIQGIYEGKFDPTHKLAA